MANRNIFYVYAGPGTAVLKAVDKLENYLKKKKILPQAERLKEDRRTIVEYLIAQNKILFLFVRMTKPENSKCVIKGNYFEGYLTIGIAPDGGYAGQKVYQLYLIPKPGD